MKVAHQSVPEGSRSAMVRLEPDQRYRPRCHACGRPAQTVHSATRKFVRDLSLADCSLMLQIEYRKIWCRHCGGVRVEQLEFVDTHQRVTHRLAAYAAQLCKAGLSVEAVARQLDLDPKTVKANDKAALEAEFGRTTYDGLKRLAIDEIAVKKGHNYMTVVLDYDTEWCEVARQDGHPALVKFAQMLERHQYGIISHCKHQIHTSKLEGVNNKIKVVKRIAYGFHDLEYFALKVKQALPGRFESN